jgi:hypothetical protein
VLGTGRPRAFAPGRNPRERSGRATDCHRSGSGRFGEQLDEIAQEQLIELEFLLRGEVGLENSEHKRRGQFKNRFKPNKHIREFREQTITDRWLFKDWNVS